MNKYKKSAIALGLIASGAFTTHALMLNEIRTDSFDNPDEEYFEIKGTPGESLDDVWLIYIGEHSGTGNFKGSGVIERAIDLTGSVIPADGIFLATRTEIEGAALGLDPAQVDLPLSILGNAFENNDNVTILLVRGFTEGEILVFEDQIGEAAVDIDDDDDGTPNAVLPWTEVIDALSLVDSENSGDFYYGAFFGGTNLGPTVEGVPWHAFRASDTDVWYAGERELFEEDADGVIIGKSELSMDTLGVENPVAPPLTLPPMIDAISTTFASVGETITVEGDNLAIATDVTVGGVAASFTVANASLEVVVPEGASTGRVEVVNADGTATSVGLVVVMDTSELILAEDFRTGIGSFSAFSVASDRDWTAGAFADTYSVSINGFGADEASDDWLLTPSISLVGTVGAYMILGHERSFGGPALEVKVSTDWDGSGSPATATWTDIAVPLAGDNTREVTDSGMVDLSAYDGASIHIAIRYTTTGTEGGDAAWDRIHYLAVAGGTLGWENSNEFGWVYDYGDGWLYSLDLGFIYTGNVQYPWIYQSNFGFINIRFRAPGIAMWLYSPSLGFAYLEEGQNGQFSAQASNWELDNFINPVD